jgi:hypothetical protein
MDSMKLNWKIDEKLVKEVFIALVKGLSVTGRDAWRGKSESLLRICLSRIDDAKLSRIVTR